MRKTILYIATSLDGYIAGPDDDLSWLFHDDGNDYGYTDFLAGVDTLVMGRATFEITRSFGDWPYPDKKSLVISSTLEDVDTPGVQVSSDDPVALVTRLKEAPEGKNIWIVGGGKLVAPLMAARLIDEFVISIHPIVLGDGTPLFPQGSGRSDLVTISAEAYPTGLIQLILRAGGQ